jgi:hypothetical protein
MKKTIFSLIIIFFVINNIHSQTKMTKADSLLHPPSIEMSIYPRSTLGMVQSVLDFVKENKLKSGKIKLKKLLYENDVLKEISGTIEFTDGISKEFNADGNFKRLYIKRTFGSDNKIYVKVMMKSESE